jgi:hypothetical protein
MDCGRAGSGTNEPEFAGFSGFYNGLQIQTSPNSEVGSFPARQCGLFSLQREASNVATRWRRRHSHHAQHRDNDAEVI